MSQKEKIISVYCLLVKVFIKSHCWMSYVSPDGKELLRVCMHFCIDLINSINIKAVCGKFSFLHEILIFKLSKLKLHNTKP